MGLNELLKKHKFTFNKAFGQNFISDNALLQEIVEKSGIDKNTTVLEIGCGAGTLTKVLSQNAKFVYGYEIDRNLTPVLKENLEGCGNVKIIFKDVMREKTADLEGMIGEKYCIVANLPYYITTPIIMKFVEQAENCNAIVIMVQEEVADRICARENTAEYGAITAGINVVADSEKIINVSRNMFYPRPNVDSAVVKIAFNKDKYELISRKVYRDTVRIAFASRRKTLVNNLRDGLKLSKEQAENLLSCCDIDLLARGETLSSDKFVQLSNAICEKLNLQ